MPPSQSLRHESVEALLAEALPGEDATDVIRRKARGIIAKARSLWKGPPFCPFALADLEGVIVEEAPCDIRSDGRIFPKGKQIFIQYAKGQCHERTRFTICHELAHTLFPDCYKRERRRSAAEKAEWEFENLCNIAASEFLFPLEEFSVDMGEAKLTAQQLRNLAARYEASVDATAHRVVSLSSHPSCVVFATYQEPPPGKVTSLTVQYAVPTADFPQKFFRGFKINSKSISNQAFRDQQPLSSPLENWMVSGKWARYRVEAVPLEKFAAKGTSDLAVLLYLAR